MKYVEQKCISNQKTSGAQKVRNTFVARVAKLNGAIRCIQEKSIVTTVEEKFHIVRYSKGQVLKKYANIAK